MGPESTALPLVMLSGIKVSSGSGTRLRTKLEHVEIVGLSRLEVEGDAILTAAVIEREHQVLRGELVIPERDHAVVVALKRPEADGAAGRIGLNGGRDLENVGARLIDASGFHVDIAILPLKGCSEMAVAVWQWIGLCEL